MASPRRNTFSINCATKLNFGQTKKGGGCSLKAELEGADAGFCEAHGTVRVSKFMTVAEVQEYRRIFLILTANARAIQNTPGPLAVAAYDAAKLAVARHREAFLLAQHNRRERVLDAESHRLTMDMAQNHLPIFLHNYSKQNPKELLVRVTLPPLHMSLDEADATRAIDAKSALLLRGFLNDHRKCFCLL
jgi:hypothetical protein